MCKFCPQEYFQYAGDLTTHLFTNHEDLRNQHEEECHGALLVRLADDAKQAAAARKVKLSGCLFCDPSEEDGDVVVDKREFTAHVGKHMEELAFYSLYPAPS